MTNLHCRTLGYLVQDLTAVMSRTVTWLQRYANFRLTMLYSHLSRARSFGTILE